MTLVDEVREVLRDGWSYTDEDLREELEKRGDDLVETLEDIRSCLADGWTYTHLDLREDLVVRIFEMRVSLDWRDLTATVSPFPSGGRLGWERRAVFWLPFIARMSVY